MDLVVQRLRAYVADRVALHRGDHVELLGAQRVDPARTRRLGELVEQLGGLGVLLGLAVELDRVQLLVLLEEQRGVPFSYAVAITYVIADTIDKTKKVLDGTKYAGDNINTCAAIEGVDALIWQLAASVALPGYTIHQLVAIVVALLDASGVDQSGVISALPTACGLAMIPFIVKPLDELAEVAMDVTFRKVSAPYLESCEV